MQLHPRHFGRNLRENLVSKLMKDVEGTCRPFKGEILEAVVTMVNKMGFFAEAGPAQIYRYYMSSTPPEISSLPRGEDNQPLEIFSGTASINDSNPTPSATQTVGVGNTAVNEGDGADTHFQKKKRAKKSAVWLEFTEETINGQLKALCNQCFICIEMKIPGEFFMTE
ncbi:hypothetical protein Tsubulata_023821 [Turnera subulata]|uniref:S1 motif domain-containing protein n=1 Tax=Turnera subulata TaxID=218843 RepID=A0A9Q0FIU5_9ROSI|nr:hypothetical protein Tsubulata_002023 [Turnera subulata]KAJ4840133.1 hypothetical protein Tsubulata_023821 [Turnera subulata]